MMSLTWKTWAEMPFRDEEAITAQKIKLKLESLTKLSNSNVCSDFMSDCEKKTFASYNLCKYLVSAANTEKLS